ncbi:2-oxopent-4-enoate hydratase [Arthrobacter saudimassiliensis]|uniref:2-oxopent-4-enoate hydratase n=1 Tax=Arthrobacter saudimassiliensis TaxID=1461584 RepID=A0A078MV60_9MICC|nr:2-oxopent-4-enoate hydratase [Arthrobacter saudimassiliensis]
MTATAERAPAGAPDIPQLAERLRRAEREGMPIEPIRAELADGGIAAAYEVQRVNEDAWIAEGRRVVGRKIGLTSKAVQAQMGVDQPDFGVLFADMCLSDGDTMAVGDVLQPRIEAEVALVLKKDLPRADTTLPELMAAVDCLLPAIEIVGSRIRNWDISILDTIADNASCGRIVTGTRPVLPSAVDLASAGMVVEVDGRVVSVGSGAACLGHPYRAGLWLVRRMAELERPLRAGEILMTGALGPMVDFRPGSSAAATIQGLGQVRINLEEK